MACCTRARSCVADVSDPETLLHGVVAQDRAEALFAWVRLGTSAAGQSGRIRLPGLDPRRSYRLSVRTELGRPSLHEHAPSWVGAALDGGFVVSGTLLTSLGLPMPTLNPQQAMLVHALPTA